MVGTDKEREVERVRERGERESERKRGREQIERD